MRNLLDMLSGNGSGLARALSGRGSGSLMELIGGGPRGGRGDVDSMDINELLGLSGGIPLIEISLGGGNDESFAEAPVVVYQTPKTTKVVKDGICEQEKQVQITLNAVSGQLQCVIAIYKDGEASEPQARWRSGFTKVQVVRILRAINLFFLLPVIDCNCFAMVSVATNDHEPEHLRGVQEVIKAVGKGPFDEVIESAPDDTEELLQKLAANHVAFCHDDIRDALRTGCLEEGTEITELGIELPDVMEARKRSEAEATKKLRKSFGKWLRHQELENSVQNVNRLCELAVLALNRGITDDQLVIGVAGALYLLEVHCHVSAADLTEQVATEHIGHLRTKLERSSDFLAKRYSTGKEAYIVGQEVDEILMWWDTTEPEATGTPVAHESAVRV